MMEEIVLKFESLKGGLFKYLFNKDENINHETCLVIVLSIAQNFNSLIT